jgi:hypothetical protein
LKIYLADTNNGNFQSGHLANPDNQFRALMSYWYYKTRDMDALIAKTFPLSTPDIFADSGAFSALTQGGAIDIDEYATWLKRWQHVFTLYANLDVIGDADRTFDNQKRLEDQGLHPLPVFHAGEGFKHLDYYLKHYQYIALGGIVAKNPSMAWLVRCFQMAEGRRIYHGFGVTTWNMLKAVPWRSVDSSTWSGGARYGKIPLFDNIKGGFSGVQLGDSKSCYAHATLLRSYGVWTGRVFGSKS